MKTVKVSLSIVLLFVFSAFAGQAQEKYKADATTSTLQWLGKKVSGEHSGTITLNSGEFAIKANKLVSGKFEVNMTSLAVVDIKDEGTNQKLLGHLKSDDFFGVAKFPTATFVIKSSDVITTKTINVKGSLTIKGVTQPIEFKANFKKTADGYKVYANVIVDRSKFGIRYGSGSFFDDLGDKLIYDEFEIKLNITTSLVK